MGLQRFDIILTRRGNQDVQTHTRIISIYDWHPNDIQTKLIDEVIYQGKNFKPDVAEKKKRAKTPPKK